MPLILLCQTAGIFAFIKFFKPPVENVVGLITRNNFLCCISRNESFALVTLEIISKGSFWFKFVYRDLQRNLLSFKFLPGFSFIIFYFPFGWLTRFVGADFDPLNCFKNIAKKLFFYFWLKHEPKEKGLWSEYFYDIFLKFALKSLLRGRESGRLKGTMEGSSGLGFQGPLRGISRETLKEGGQIAFKEHQYDGRVRAMPFRCWSTIIYSKKNKPDRVPLETFPIILETSVGVLKMGFQSLVGLKIAEKTREKGNQDSIHRITMQASAVTCKACFRFRDVTLKLVFFHKVTDTVVAVIIFYLSSFCTRWADVGL